MTGSSGIRRLFVSGSSGDDHAARSAARRRPAIGLVEVVDFTEKGWHNPAASWERSRWCCERLEEGEILYFRESPIAPPPEDRSFLIGVRQSGSAHHKNISYRRNQHRVKGYDRSGIDESRLARVLEQYSERAIAFAARLLAPYARSWKVDIASFRPIEERGRRLPLKARNDLLHVDAFPTRPTYGGRILRVFTNLNPEEPRVWLSGDPFEKLARQYALEAGLRECAGAQRSPLGRVARGLRWAARAAGFGAAERSAYDRFMLRFHDYLKSHTAFQEKSPRSRWEFPPGSSWVVFTDGVPHAVVSGRFALEQTFVVSRRDLVRPEKAPVNVLEKLCGVELAGGQAG